LGKQHTLITFLNTSIPAPYLSFLFGLLARTLHVSYATVRSSYPNNEAWEGESIDAEIFGSQHNTGPIQDSDDEILEISPAYAHLLPSNTHRTTEIILNTSDYMLVDPPPVTSQEKGKSRIDDLPPVQSGSGTSEEQQQNDKGWQTVTRKKKKSSKKNKTQYQDVLRVMTEHKPTSHQKVHKLMVYDVPSTW
jgi:hypothetical protein